MGLYNSIPITLLRTMLHPFFFPGKLLLAIFLKERILLIFVYDSKPSNDPTNFGCPANFRVVPSFQFHYFDLSTKKHILRENYFIHSIHAPHSPYSASASTPSCSSSGVLVYSPAFFSFSGSIKSLKYLNSSSSAEQCSGASVTLFKSCKI